MTITPPTAEDIINILQQRYEKPNRKFVVLIKQLFGNGQEASDAAFDELMRHADEFFDELVIAFEIINAELMSRDDGSYSWYHHALLDCIACAHSPKVLKILWRELQSPNEQARQVAIWDLGRVGKRDKEARKILWNARSYEFASSEETQRFRETIEKALKDKR